MLYLSCFFFNDTATTEIYTLSLHDALPIYKLLKSIDDEKFSDISITIMCLFGIIVYCIIISLFINMATAEFLDRKSTRLNSSHANISYAVFCLKKKKNYEHNIS